MSFKILILPPDAEPSLPAQIREAVPGVNVLFFDDAAAAAAEIEDADAVYGFVPPELLARAKKLRWIATPRAGAGGEWYYDALVQSDVTVTNVRGAYNEDLAAHAVGFLLAFARRFDYYLKQTDWERGPEIMFLPDKTALIVGVGGSGTEATKLCAAFGMRVIGCDPRTKVAPEGMAELFDPSQLPGRIGEADFVLCFIPETPDSLDMFDAAMFGRMKRGAYFINVGRGGVVVTDDLVAALRSGQLGGAGLDVVIPEPLPPEHPLWQMPNVLITPHIAVWGSPYRERWSGILVENCRRFDRGEPLLNVVDKAKWF
jgi:phosphoglycerate dehydrogenase-like enzyme